MKKKESDYYYPDDVAVIEELAQAVSHTVHRTFLIVLSRNSVLIKIICRYGAH